MPAAQGLTSEMSAPTMQITELNEDEALVTVVVQEKGKERVLIYRVARYPMKSRRQRDEQRRARRPSLHPKPA